MTFQVPTPATAAPVVISPKGSPNEKIWLLAEEPLPKDRDRGYLFSSPMGWSYDKLIQEAGIRSYYCCCPSATLESELNRYRPPLIVALDTASTSLTSNIRKREDIGLWAGSLLTSDKLSYPHYIMPTFGPEACISDWTERQVVKYIDYGKLRGELEYFNQHSELQPLPKRNLQINLSFYELLNKLHAWCDDQVEFISVDIETIYPKAASAYYGVHPGVPVTIGIAPSPHHGISFPLFWDSADETKKIWGSLANLLSRKKIIGQNFFGFDAWYFEMLGLNCDRLKITDTLFRHALLWPELSHKLDFQTRQYTRQPFYKQDGKGWSIKNLDGLKRYNALDVTVTYEIYLEQEKEFNERPNLR